MNCKVAFAGPCPFVLCLVTEPHEHPVCPECGAVNYGNISCKRCVFVRAPDLYEKLYGDAR